MRSLPYIAGPDGLKTDELSPSFLASFSFDPLDEALLSNPLQRSQNNSHALISLAQPDPYIIDEFNVDRLRLEASELLHLARILAMNLEAPHHARAEFISEIASAEIRKIYSPLSGKALERRSDKFERMRFRLAQVIKVAASR